MEPGVITYLKKANNSWPMHSLLQRNFDAKQDLSHFLAV